MTDKPYSGNQNRSEIIRETVFPMRPVPINYKQDSWSNEFGIPKPGLPCSWGNKYKNLALQVGGV
jgi:hypothetical protein